MLVELDEEHTKCSICVTKFSSDRYNTDPEIRKHLPVLSSSQRCDHWFCHGCVLREQLRVAEENNGRVPKWIKCMHCREATSFNPAEPKYHRLLIDLLARAQKYAAAQVKLDDREEDEKEEETIAQVKDKDGKNNVGMKLDPDNNEKCMKRESEALSCEEREMKRPKLMTPSIPPFQVKEEPVEYPEIGSSEGQTVISADSTNIQSNGGTKSRWESRSGTVGYLPDHIYRKLHPVDRRLWTKFPREVREMILTDVGSKSWVRPRRFGNLPDHIYRLMDPFHRGLWTKFPKEVREMIVTSASDDYPSPPTNTENQELKQKKESPPPPHVQLKEEPVEYDASPSLPESDRTEVVDVDAMEQLCSVCKRMKNLDYFSSNQLVKGDSAKCNVCIQDLQTLGWSF